MPARETGPRAAWPPRPVYLTALPFFVLYTLYSLLRHAQLGTAGFDLGIFDQAVRAYANFDAPVVPLKGPGFNLLGDHFHPALIVLVPLYWLWADARMLLIAQAALMAISVVPIARLAIGRLGVRAGLAVAAAYGLSWGIQGALGFDFHEIALAVPLIAYAMAALAEERWRAAARWTLPLLLVKEDMGLTVAAVGGYLLLRRQWRLGGALVAAGATALALILLVVIPHFSPSGEYRYWGSVRQGGDQGLLGQLLSLPGGFAEHPDKWILPICLLGVTAFAALRSPLLIIAAPVVLYRLASNNPLHWSVGFVHYNAILMPIVFVAFLDALSRLGQSDRRAARAFARLSVPVAVVFAVGVLPQFAFWRFTSPDFYRFSPGVTAARDLMREIPDGATVAAGDYLAPQLTDRCAVVLFPDPFRRATDWVIVDTTRLSVVPAPEAQQRAALQALPGQGFRLVGDRAGILLFHRA
ncbi:DUF2079 domain-containing protein [Actinomadura scrupuli]|uniref:DUF2079 domain-containing protein n=1 Tax=Actinomadura scrupuli TaxID=559629 RepID=UPI003D96D9EF